MIDSKTSAVVRSSYYVTKLKEKGKQSRGSRDEILRFDEILNDSRGWCSPASSA
jgi:hypothetical protein